MSGPQAALLPDGRRLHLNHGPIDLIVEAFGPERERRAALAAARRRFDTILEELVAELPRLRRPLPPGRCAAYPRGVQGGQTAPLACPPFASPTACRMAAAIAPHAPAFVTPMAAVAGAVADEVLAALVGGRDLRRAYVNNGGDIALWLAPGERLTAAVAGPGGCGDRLTVRHADPVRGIATSGWRGRSHSLGIADAVTVTAPTAAAADAAATLIANAVDLADHPAIRRTPATDLDPDSDLGRRLVTTGVGPLTGAEADRALAAGAARAEGMRRVGLIAGAALFLGGRVRVVGARSAVAA